MGTHLTPKASGGLLRPPAAHEILLVEDESSLRAQLVDILRDEGHRVTECATGDQAFAHLASAERFDLVLCDVRLPDADGFEILRRARSHPRPPQIIMMTGFSSSNDAVTAFREGADEYLIKPFAMSDLISAVRRAGSRPAEEATSPAAFVSLVGNSAPMLRLRERIAMISDSDAPVLISGESGTGKELVARMVHQQSRVRAGPFVVVNCAALPDHLVEAELFGHERGAFTGAYTSRPGRFKSADGGTIFLDEIGELSLAAQCKLLRVLQEGTFEPVGTSTTVSVDVRVVSATNRDIKAGIGEGTFREDLYYRINVVSLGLAPLRERSGDLPLLVAHFLAKHAPDERQRGLTPAAWAALSRYPFPGNVRELEHAIQQSLLFTYDRDIDVGDLPEDIAGCAGGQTDALEPLPGGIRPLATVVQEFERRYLLRVLETMKGHRTRTAKALGISRKTLWEKLRSFGVSDSAD